MSTEDGSDGAKWLAAAKAEWRSNAAVRKLLENNFEVYRRRKHFWEASPETRRAWRNSFEAFLGTREIGGAEWQLAARKAWDASREVRECCAGDFAAYRLARIDWERYPALHECWAGFGDYARERLIAGGAATIVARNPTGAREQPAGARARSEATPGSEPSIELLKRAWLANEITDAGVPVQEEFGGDRDAYLAYHKAATAGLVTIRANPAGVKSAFARRSTLPVDDGDAPGARKESKMKKIDVQDTVLIAKREWAMNGANEAGVALQDEFGGDFEAFAAFRTHELAGLITIAGKRSARSRTAARGQVPDVSILRREWNANKAAEDGVRPQEQFEDEAGFIAFRQAVARGLVQIRAHSPGVVA